SRLWPGPTYNFPFVSVMVWPWTLPANSIVSPLAAAAISPRSDPSPLTPVSLLFVTIRMLGKALPSSSSSRGWWWYGWYLRRRSFRRVNRENKDMVQTPIQKNQVRRRGTSSAAFRFVGAPVSSFLSYADNGRERAPTSPCREASRGAARTQPGQAAAHQGKRDS